MGDLNIAIADKTKDICNYFPDLRDTFSLTKIINSTTCFKEQKGKSIDVLLTNRSGSFDKRGIFEKCISNHHKLILSVFRSYFTHIPPEIIE